MQEFMKKRENDKINDLVDKYDRKPLTVKEKKYIIFIVKIVVGALSAPSN